MCPGDHRVASLTDSLVVVDGAAGPGDGHPFSLGVLDSGQLLDNDGPLVPQTGNLPADPRRQRCPERGDIVDGLWNGVLLSYSGHGHGTEVTDVRGRAGVKWTVLAQDSAETGPRKDHGIYVGIDPIDRSLAAGRPADLTRAVEGPKRYPDPGALNCKDCGFKSADDCRFKPG